MSEYFTLARGGRISGGASVTGGFVATGGYADSKLPAEKQKLIRALAASLRDSFGLKGDVSKMSPEKLIAAMEKTIPNRSKLPNGSPLIQSSDAQKSICKKMAVALNKHANMSLDPDESPDALCDQVSEALHSIFTGVRGEFLSVTKDVRTSLQNLLIMKNSLKNSFDSIMKVVEKSTDSSVKTQARSVNMIYKGLIDVLNNQIAVLSNTLNMRIDPVSSTIADLSEKDAEWKGYVRKLKKDLGVPRIGHRLAFTLAGLKHSAIMANEVNLALKQIGASVSDYTSHPKLKDLERHLADLWEKHHGKPTMDDVANLMASLDIIRAHHYNHKDIGAELKRKGGAIISGGRRGGCDGMCGGDADAEIGAVPGFGTTGGFYNVAGGETDMGGEDATLMIAGVSGGNLKKLDKRMKNQKVFRKMLLKDFKRKLEDHAQRLARSVEILGKQLGKSIPLDDNLEAFKNAFRVLANDSIHRVNFYMAISGFQTDPRSKDERARFLGNLKAARRATQPLLQNASTKSYFQSVAKSLDDLVSFVDGFSDRYLKPMSKLLVKTPDVTNIDPSIITDDSLSDVAGGKKKRRKKTGGDGDAEEDDDGSDEEEECNCGSGKKKSECDCKKDGDNDEGDADAAGGDAGTEYHFVSLKKVARDLVFYHGVAKMRDNLKGVETQIQSASKDYTTISGEAVGDMVVTAKKRYNAWLKDWEDEDSPNSMGTWLKANWTDNKNFTDDDYKIYFASNNRTTNPLNATNTQQPPQSLIKFVTENVRGTDNDPRMDMWKKGVLDNIKKFKKLQVECRVKLYKTAEAIDLYLIHFANAVASDPGSVRSLFDITKSLDAIAHWYTDRSGASLAQLFESMPYNKDGHGHHVNVDVEADFPLNGDHYYERIRLLLDPESTNPGNPAGSANHRPPTNKGMGNPFLSMLCGTRKTNNDLNELLKRAKSACTQVRVLDNIIKLFAQAGNKIGGKDLDSEQYMPLEMIKQNLCNYIFMSAFTMGCGKGANAYDDTGRTSTHQNGNSVNQPGSVGQALPANGPDRADQGGGIHDLIGFDVTGTSIMMGRTNASVRPKDAPGGKFQSRSSTAVAGNKLPSGTKPSGANRTETARWMSQNYGIAMRPISGLYESFSDTSQLDDSIFVMIVKSMVAKVFTVISAYGVTNKPLAKYSSISNARQIMGGGKRKKKRKSTRGAGALDSIPEVICEATELYIRLPLLAEFYREVLKFEDMSSKTPSSKLKKISMVPEMDDVWQDLIKIVFDEAKHVEEGTYSENQVRRLIRAVNDIYRKYKSGGDKKTITSAINGFVAEINRRYGVVEQRHIDEYINDRKSRYSSQSYNDDETPDYDLLDKNSAGSQGRRPLPSDRFDTVGDHKIEVENKFNQDWINMVRRFRNNIDREICKNKPSAMDFSFTTTIIQQKRKVCAGKDNSQRYKDVLKAVQSSDQLNNVNHYKSLMFHEAVVSPLATLYSLYTLLKRFCDTAESLDLRTLEREIKDNYAALCGAGVGQAQAVITAANGPKPYHAHLMIDGLIQKGRDGADAQIASVLTAMAGNAAIGGRDQELCEQFLQRYLVNRDKAFKEMVEVVWGIGTDLSELVTVKIESNHLICDFSKMTDYILYTMRATKSNLEKFRNVVSPTVIRLYEGGIDTSNNRGSGPSENPASIYWLEENLVEILIKGRDATDGYGLDVANERLAGCYSSLKRKWDVIGRLHAAGAVPGVTAVAGVPTDMAVSAHSGKRVASTQQDNPLWKAWEDHLQCLRQHSVDAPMEHLVYWDHKGTSMKSEKYEDNNSRQNWPFAILPRSVDLLEKDDAEDGARLKLMEEAFKDVLTEYASLGPNPAFAAGSVGPRIPANFRYNGAADTYLQLVDENKDLAIVRGRMEWYSNGKNHDWKKMSDCGLLVDLNQTLSYYLRSCYDPSMRKMYAPLVKHFGEGSNAGEVMNGKALDDLTKLPANATIGVPAKGSTIFASLAQVIKNTLQSRKNNHNRDPRYRCDALMEVPDHIKENLRSALPSYGKMFHAVRVKAEMLRKFAQHMSTTRFYNTGTAINANVANNNGQLLDSQFKHINSGSIFNGPQSEGAVAGTFDKGNGKTTNGRSPLYQWGVINGRRAGTTGHPNVCVPYDPHVPGDCNEQREFFTAILDGIKSSAQSLEKCCNNVYEELGDINPRYGELSEGSLEDYNESNKHDPVAPLSAMQIGLRNRSNTEDESSYASTGFMLPFYRSKENPHKLNYGARKVFGALHASTSPDPNFEQLYGPKVLLDGYNAISSADTRLDEAQYEKSMGAHAMLLRYVLDSRNTRHCYSLEGFDTTFGDAALSSGTVSSTNADWKNEYKPYSMQNNLSRLIALMESSDADSAVREINKAVKGSEIVDIDRRSQARIFNLIDMSIVPINVHAMMRDVPLVNLINYSYTFDRMAQEYLLPDVCDLMKCDQEIDTSAALLNKMILHPYCELSDQEYDALLHRLMTGDSSLGLGRPKYLSDQVYNKVLFRDIYRFRGDHTAHRRPDESGPAASSAQHRFTRNGPHAPGGPHSNLNRSYTGTEVPDHLQYLKKENVDSGESWQEFRRQTWENDGDRTRNPNRQRRPKIEPVTVALSPASVQKARFNIGKLRFDSMMVRNLMFLVNIQRLCRTMMRDELTHIESAVITGDTPSRSMDYISSSMTDYNRNENVEDHENQFRSRRKATARD